MTTDKKSVNLFYFIDKLILNLFFQLSLINLLFILKGKIFILILKK